MATEHEKIAEKIYFELLDAVGKNPNDTKFNFQLTKSSFPFSFDELKLKEILEKIFPCEIRVSTFDGNNYEFIGVIK